MASIDLKKPELVLSQVSQLLITDILGISLFCLPNEIEKVLFLSSLHVEGLKKPSKNVKKRNFDVSAMLQFSDNQTYVKVLTRLQILEPLEVCFAILPYLTNSVGLLEWQFNCSHVLLLVLSLLIFVFFSLCFFFLFSMTFYGQISFY